MVSTERVPSPLIVFTKPLDVRFERLVIFCVVFTLNALPEYVSPVPAVVVAPDETSPPYTASPPLESDESRNDDEKVDDAVEKRPLVKPMVVEVLLYPVLRVYGNAKVE